MKKHKIMVLFFLALMGIFLIPFTSVNAAKQGSVTPSCGKSGTTFTFTITGFESQEQVGYWATGPEGQTFDPNSRPFANQEGQLSFAWTAPAEARGGAWNMMVRGYEGNRETTTIPFCIEAPETPHALAVSSMVMPDTKGPPGTTFTFVTRGGFKPNEQVASWFIMPSGGRLNADIGISSDKNGQVYRVWTSPADAMGGQWLFQLRGLNSGHEIGIPFFIVNPSNTPPSPAPSNPPSLYATATPDHGPRGTTFTFAANGFKPGERVGTWVVRPDETTIDNFTDPYRYANDNDGSITWTWTAPRDGPQGTWKMNIRGIQSRVEWTILFFIDGPELTPTPIPQAHLTVSPDSGPRDSNFLFMATGYIPGETIFYWAIAPEGFPPENAKEVKADGNGTASWRWSADADQPAGQWSMASRGKASRREAQAAFIVVGEERKTTSVEPCCGGPNTTFSFFATGFKSQEKIDLWLTGPDPAFTPRRFDQIYDITNSQDADETGSISWKWNAPEGIEGGIWKVTARGEESRIERVIELTIVRDTPLPQRYTVSPASGPPGTIFTFTAEDLPSDQVAYWLTAPDGSILPGDTSERKHWRLVVDQGHVSWTWQSPLDAKPGQWMMVVRNVPNNRRLLPLTGKDDWFRYLRDRDRYKKAVEQVVKEYREYQILFTIE